MKRNGFPTRPALLLTLLLLGGGALVAWSLRPRPVHVLARYPSRLGRLWTSDTGFLVMPATGVYSLRDWRDGRERWRVTVPEAHPQLTLSASGHYCAARTDTRLRVWQAGRLVTDTTLSGEGRGVLREDGVYLALSGDAGSATAVAPGGARAHGRLPADALLSPDGHWCRSATPAGTLVSRLAIRDGRITPLRAYTATTPVSPFLLPRLSRHR